MWILYFKPEMKTIEVQYKGKTVKVNESYPIQELKTELHNLEETPLHAQVKKMLATKLRCMTSQELCGSETWEEADKKFPIRDHLSGQPARNLIYNYIPRQNYNNKVYEEKDFPLETSSGGRLYIKPDVCIFHFKPLSIFEIIVTSKPKIDKLIAMIEAPVNVVFIYAEDVIGDLSRKFNIHTDWGNLFKCFTGWRAEDSLITKVSRTVDMLIADKFPAKYHDILEKKICFFQKEDVYNLYVKTPEWGWKPHTGSRKGKPTSPLNSLIKYYAEKTAPILEAVSYRDNSMTVEFVVRRTYNNYEDPFHVGTILEAFQGEKTLFTNREAGIVNKTNYQNIKDGQKIRFVCGVNNYGTNGRNKYYANHLANGKDNLNKVWVLE